MKKHKCTPPKSVCDNAVSVLAELRETYFMSQEWLANQIGISRGHLNRILNGKSLVDYDIYERIIRFRSMTKILLWIESSVSEREKDNFRSALSATSISDPYIKTVYCASMFFGNKYLWYSPVFDATDTPSYADKPEDVWGKAANIVLIVGPKEKE